MTAATPKKPKAKTPAKKKVAAKKTPAKAAAKKAAPAKSAPTTEKKATPKKSPAKKSPAKKAAPKKSPAKKAPPRKVAAKKAPAKAPARKKAQRKAPPDKSRQLLDLVTRILDDQQADDVTVIDLAGKSAMADFMVVASGRNPRHIGAMAQNLREKIKGAGLGVPALEGMTNADWVLIDGGDVVVHLFRPEVRGLYNLEKMWSTEFRDVEAEYGLDRPH